LNNNDVSVLTDFTNNNNIDINDVVAVDVLSGGDASLRSAFAERFFSGRASTPSSLLAGDMP